MITRDLIREPKITSRSPVSWPGGKWYARSQIIPILLDLLRGKHNLIVSPFLGAGHIELALAAKGVNVWGSDIYPPLVRLWEALKGYPEEFAEELRKRIGGYPLTMERARSAMMWWHNLADNSSDLDVALALFASTKLGYGGFVGRYKPHPDPEGKSVKAGRHRDFRLNAGLHERLKAFYSPLLHVEEMDYREALASTMNHTVAYCDPPYRISTCLYGVRGEVHKAFDHDEFADFMLRRDGPWAVSYNDCKEVREAFAGCAFHNIFAKYSIGKAIKQEESREVLIIHE